MMACEWGLLGVYHEVLTNFYLLKFPYQLLINPNFLGPSKHDFMQFQCRPHKSPLHCELN